MTPKHLLRVLTPLPIAATMLLSGCVTPEQIPPGTQVDLRPFQGPVGFLSSDKDLSRDILQQVNRPIHSTEKVLYLSLRKPSRGVMHFPQNFTAEGKRVKASTLNLVPGTPRELRMSAGVYPFVLKADPMSSPYLSGMFVVYNVDEDTSLATLGLDENEDPILSPEMIEKARNGGLGQFTVDMDEDSVMTVYAGNRKQADLHSFAGTTALLDFSKTPGIRSLSINGVNYPNFEAKLPIYKMTVDAYNRPVPKLANHKLKFTTTKGSFQGIIRMKGASLETRLTKLNCEIEEDLLHSASEGSLSKYSLRTIGDKHTMVQIAFGIARNR